MECRAKWGQQVSHSLGGSTFFMIPQAISPGTIAREGDPLAAYVSNECGCGLLSVLGQLSETPCGDASQCARMYSSFLRPFGFGFYRGFA